MNVGCDNESTVAFRDASPASTERKTSKVTRRRAPATQLVSNARALRSILAAARRIEGGLDAVEGRADETNKLVRGFGSRFEYEMTTNKRLGRNSDQTDR